MAMTGKPEFSVFSQLINSLAVPSGNRIAVTITARGQLGRLNFSGFGTFRHNRFILGPC